jgi:hypothetical protein
VPSGFLMNRMGAPKGLLEGVRRPFEKKKKKRKDYAD